MDTFYKEQYVLSIYEHSFFIDVGKVTLKCRTITKLSCHYPTCDFDQNVIFLKNILLLNL